MVCTPATAQQQDWCSPVAITLSALNTVLQNNPFPVALEGGLLPESAIPVTGNTVNAIDVGNGGFAGRGRWSQLGLSYRLTQPTTDLPGGDLTVDPGVIVEATDPNAALRFRSTRHSVLKGLPDYPDHLPWPQRTTLGRFAFCYKLYDRLPLGVLHDRERAFRRRQHG